MPREIGYKSYQSDILTHPTLVDADLFPVLPVGARSGRYDPTTLSWLHGSLHQLGITSQKDQSSGDSGFADSSRLCLNHICAFRGVEDSIPSFCWLDVPLPAASLCQSPDDQGVAACEVFDVVDLVRLQQFLFDVTAK
jgi:hypothetical protein